MTVMFRPTQYMRPERIEEAVRLLAKEPDTARVIAGGTDLLVAKPADTKRLVDVAKLGLGEVRVLEGAAAGAAADEVTAARRALRVGAAVTVAELAEAEVLREHPCWKVLAEAAAALGTPGVRNRATIGGNLCNASPAADLAVAALALGVAVEVMGPRGARVVAVEDFFLGPNRTVLEPGELVTAVLVPAWTGGPGSSPRDGANGPDGRQTPADSGGERAAGERAAGAFLKLRRHQSLVDIATVNVAVAVSMAAGVITRVRVALGAVAETPLLSAGAATVLAGREPSPEVVAAAGAAAAADARPIDDLRASADYRRAMTAVLVRRAVSEAVRRCES